MGGVIGVVGTIVGPPLVHWLNEKAAKRKQRIEKLGELIAVVYENDDWLDLYRNVNVFGIEKELGPSPFPKIVAITAIHFPQFNQLINEFDLVVGHYKLWVLKGGKKRLDKQIDKLAEGFDQVNEPYLEKRNEVLRTLKEYAKAEFGE